MTGKLIKSILEEAVKDLPEDFAIKAESVPGMLAKKGVKPEEVKFSRIGLMLPETGKVTKQELEGAVAGRADQFGVEEPMLQQYNWVSLERGKDNPTYRERIYTYNDKYGDAVRYTTEHFADTPNYLMHTRLYDDTFDGTPTRVLQEVQSDLHQQGRQYGYAEGAVQLTAEERQIVANADWWSEAGPDDPSVLAAMPILERAGFNIDQGLSFDEFAYELLQGKRMNAPTSPYEKTWLRKGLEREIVDAIESGRHQLAVPLTGAVGELQRAPGVQKWYETQVASTLQKLAKSHGFEYEVKTLAKQGAKPKAVERKVDGLESFAEDIAQLKPEAVDRVVRGWANNSNLPDEVRMLSRMVVNGDITVKEAQQQAGILIENASKSSGDVTYAVVKFQPEANAPYAPEVIERVTRSLLAHGTNVASGVAKAYDLDSKVVNEELRSKVKDAIRAKTDANVVVAEALGGKPTVKAPTKGFSLYASPAAATMAAYTAFKAGYGQDEVTAQLEADGYSEAEIAEIYADVNKVANAKELGYADEDIRQMLDQQEVQVQDSTQTPLTVPDEFEAGRIQDARAELMSKEIKSMKDLVANMEVVYPDLSFATTNIAGYFGNEEARQISQATAEASIRAVQNALQQHPMLKQAGVEIYFDPEQSEWVAHTDEGQFIVTPEWYKSLWTAKGEIIGAMAGGIGGALYGAKIGSKAKLPGWGKAATTFLGSVAGAVPGSVAGAELDYMWSALETSQAMNEEVMARRALTAAEMSVIGDLAAAGLFKIVGKSWRGVRDSVKWVREGGMDRAKTALKETLFITDEEADQVVKELSRVAKVPGTTDTEKAIAAVASTQPGAEALVKVSALTDPKASRAVVKSVSDRAKDVLESTKELAGEDVGRWLTGELEGYRTIVRDNFGRVKAAAASAPGANRFKFNYDKLALDPVLERLGKNIENPDLAFKFARQAQRIRDMSSTRTLADLIELRKLVNEFKFNTRISRKGDYDMLNEVLQRIDGGIRQGAFATMENPKQWMSEFMQANHEYAEMKRLEKNALVKVLDRPGVSEKAIGQALAKYATAVDSTFVEVMAQLPKQSKVKMEGAVINSLAEKYTAGLEGGMRATNFPLLAKDLEQITFTSPDARKMKKALLQLANVFKNDVPLAQVAGDIQIPRFQSYLTTDPVVRAQYEVATGVFNWVKSLGPGQQARSLRLVQATAKVLENPLQSKSIKELQEMAAGEVDVDAALQNLVQEAAKKQAETGWPGAPRVRMYGSGKVLSGKGTGPEQLIPLHRVASTDVIAQVAEATGINRADKKALDLALRDRGYMAVQLGADKIRLIE